MTPTLNLSKQKNETRKGNSLTHSLTQLLTYSLTQLLTYLLTHSPTHRRAPKLSLKNLYTNDEVVFMENQFRDLLNASKKTLKSVFHFPLDAEITPAAGLLGLDKTLKNLLKKKKIEDEVMNPYRASQDLSSIKAAIDQVLAGGADEVKAEQEVVTIHDVVSKRKDAALVDETEDEVSVTSESVVGNTFIIETVADTNTGTH